MLNQPERLGPAALGRLGGFTLVELMVVVAIVAILANIAIPAYTAHVTRGRIAEATDGLALMQSQLEGYFLDHRSYASSLACTTVVTGKNFQFTASCPATASPPSYIAQAVGIGPMAGFNYTVDQNYNKTTTIAASWTGWSGSSSCWITNKGGIC